MARTYMAKAESIERGWKIVDVSDRVLGRAASRIAHVLRGKDKPTYTPHADVGDFVVVVNAAKVKLTGKKGTDKIYIRHSQFPGGVRRWTADELRAKRPEDLIRLAVKRMLPNTPLGRRVFKKLKVYPGSEHPHAAQQPQPLNLQ